MIIPLKKEYPVTQVFNDYRYRASYAKFGLLGHNGIDFGVKEGTEVIAPHDGKIVENLFDAGGYGNYIKIENDKEFSVLAHFKTLSPLRVGTYVKQGDLVGLSGTTGNSTGPHLHWGYCYKPRNRDNGFNGYVDQLLLMPILGIVDKLNFDLNEMRKSRNKCKEEREELENNYEKLQTKFDSIVENNGELESELASLKNALEHNMTPLDAKDKDGKYKFLIKDFIKETIRRFINNEMR